MAVSDNESKALYNLDRLLRTLEGFDAESGVNLDNDDYRVQIEISTPLLVRAIAYIGGMRSSRSTKAVKVMIEVTDLLFSVAETQHPDQRQDDLVNAIMLLQDLIEEL